MIVVIYESSPFLFYFYDETERRRISTKEKKKTNYKLRSTFLRVIHFRSQFVWAASISVKPVDPSSTVLKESLYTGNVSRYEPMIREIGALRRCWSLFHHEIKSECVVSWRDRRIWQHLYSGTCEVNRAERWFNRRNKSDGTWSFLSCIFVLWRSQYVASKLITYICYSDKVF